VKENQTTHTPKTTRPTIGFAVHVIADEYGALLWNGVLDAVQEADANLICYPGRDLESTRGFDRQANVIFDLIDPSLVDGLVLSSSVLSNYAGLEGCKRFCQRYRSLPLASIAVALKGVPSVVVDNRSGIHEVMTHLITVHGCRRIAFFRAREGNPEAEARYGAYIDALAEHGLPFDPQLVSPPANFEVVSGIEATRLLLDERGLRPQTDFDAIVTSSDRIAAGASIVLKERGIHVPHELIIAGFDDMESAQFAIPPLTTVYQPIREQARQATQLVLAQLRGEQVPELVSLPTRLVVRQSCGCAARRVVQAAVGTIMQSSATLESAIDKQRGEILSDTSGALESSSLSAADQVKWTGQLLDAFVAELAVQAPPTLPGPFLSTLEEVLRLEIIAGSKVLIWQSVLSILRRYALPHLDSPEARKRAEDLWAQARVLVSEAAWQSQGYKELLTRQQAQALRDIGQELVTTLDLAELGEFMARSLPGMGVPTCYLSLYENPKAPLDRARLALAYNEEGIIPLEADGQRFPSPQLVPDRALLDQAGQAFTFVVEPLYFRQQQIGFALLGGTRDGTIYEVLRGQLSSALQNILLIQQVEKRALQLQAAAEVSQAVSSILEPSELIQQVVDLARHRFDLYYAGLFLVDQSGEWTGEPGRWAVLRAGTGEAGQQMLARGHKLEIGGESMIGSCIATKQARIALDVGKEAVRFSNPFLPETRSEMALPLISRDEAIGALTIQSTREAAFTDEDIAVLQTMASQVANVIANVRLFENVQAALKEMEATQRRYLGQAWAEHAQTAGAGWHEAVRLGTPRLGEALLPEAQQAMQRRSLTVLSGDAAPDEKYTGLVTPITLRDQVIGAMGVHAGAERQWTEDDIALIEAVAERIAQVAENLRLFDETQRRAVREQVISEVTARMRESLDVDKVLQAAAREFGEKLGMAEVNIRLVPHDTDREK
jgi:sigma-B regulation protein RsbU (phosphoserine phosphatase)